MKLKKLLDRRAGYSLASLGLLLGMAAPAVVPAFASAELLTDRSITMSSSAVGATGVSYKVKFTAPTVIGADQDNEGGVIIDFCSNTAVIGDSCDAPTGLNVNPGGSLTLADVKYNDSDPASDGSISGTGNHIEWTAGTATTAGATIELTLNGITNPSDVGVFYARITTYADKGDFDTYVDEEEVGAYADAGSVALAATAGIGVSGYVLESMIFCVSGDEPSVNCGIDEVNCDPGGGPVDEGCVTAPNVVLGEEQAEGVFALVSNAVSTASIFAQLSSNASGGVVVNLKSDALGCGGLYLNGDTDECHIAPQTNSVSTINPGDAKFGLKVGAAQAAPLTNGNPGSGTGNFGVADGSGYGDTNYFIDYAEGDATGVTSTYGSPLLQAEGSVDNMNVEITFGASANNNTPAGAYGATLNMVAVGTF